MQSKNQWNSELPNNLYNKNRKFYHDCFRERKNLEPINIIH